jgi:hypothetical protein
VHHCSIASNDEVPDMEDFQLPCLLTVRQFSEKHPAFTESSLRWLIFQANSKIVSQCAIYTNGLQNAILRIGGRVLIDERKFFVWLSENQSGKR